MEIIEDKKICSKCGGKYCIKCGCDYWTEDIKDKSLKGILKLLSEENISIVALMHFKNVKGKLINEPFLYLRARNIDRDIIDLLSLKKTLVKFKSPSL